MANRHMLQEEARTKMRAILAKVDDICDQLTEEESIDLLDDMVNELLDVRAKTYRAYTDEPKRPQRKR